VASKGVRNLVAAGVILVAFAVIGVAWMVIVQPALQEQLVGATSGDGGAQQTVTIHLDSFSGYAPLRSARMRELLRRDGIRLEIVDDGADYSKRIRALDRRRADFAAFTIDALLLAGHDLGRSPGAIVAVLDETAGADAIVAYRDAIPNLRALDDPKASLVLTPASPSEFLARVAIAELGIGRVSRWWENATGAQDVYERLKKADRTKKQAFALWEPWVSRALEDPAVHKVFDSSQVSGYIVDVLVAERTLLRDRPELARAVVAAWLTTLHEVHEADGLSALVQTDSRVTGDPLTTDQAGRVARGIRWRNTLENYAYFGIVPAERAGVVRLDDAIGNIADVVHRTGATPVDPIGDRAATLFFPDVLRGLHDADFHPGKAGGSHLGTADLRAALPVGQAAPPLSEDEWRALTPVGAMSVPPISFGRGSANLNVQSRRELDALGRRLRALPTFYVTVVGQTRAEGDLDANLRLAAERAEAARAHLVTAGVQSHRLRTVSAPPVDAAGAAQAVRFELAQRPY
jgi:ABC-type nitrate/sulfonate/bicarbonate transport system substrate-binding protein